MMVVVIEMAHAVRVGFGKCRREHGTGDCGGGEDLRKTDCHPAATQTPDARPDQYEKRQ